MIHEISMFVFRECLSFFCNFFLLIIFNSLLKKVLWRGVLWHIFQKCWLIYNKKYNLYVWKLKPCYEHFYDWKSCKSRSLTVYTIFSLCCPKYIYILISIVISYFKSLKIEVFTFFDPRIGFNDPLWHMVKNWFGPNFDY